MSVYTRRALLGSRGRFQNSWTHPARQPHRSRPIAANKVVPRSQTRIPIVGSWQCLVCINQLVCIMKQEGEMQSHESEGQQVTPEQGWNPFRQPWTGLVAQCTWRDGQGGLQRAQGLTGGNLTLPLRKLEDAGYIATTKEFVDTKSRTWVEATREGLRAYSDYLANLQRTLNISPR